LLHTNNHTQQQGECQVRELSVNTGCFFIDKLGTLVIQNIEVRTQYVTRLVDNVESTLYG